MKGDTAESSASLKFIAALFCSVSASLLVLMYTADWWSLNEKPVWPSGKLLMLRIAGSTVLSFFICTLIFWMRFANSRTKLYFCCWFAFCMLVFVASWPGYLMSDSVSALKYSFEYPVELWLGF